MADDTPTVGEANRALLEEIHKCLKRADVQGGDDSGRIVELIDALIAAVRAENDAETQDLIKRAERYMAELQERRS